MKICFVSILKEDRYTVSTLLKEIKAPWQMKVVELTKPVNDLHDICFGFIAGKEHLKSGDYNEDCNFINSLKNQIKIWNPHFLHDKFKESMQVAENSYSVIVNTDCKSEDYDFLRALGFTFIFINNPKVIRENVKSYYNDSYGWENKIFDFYIDYEDGPALKQTLSNMISNIISNRLEAAVIPLHYSYSDRMEESLSLLLWRGIREFYLFNGEISQSAYKTSLDVKVKDFLTGICPEAKVDVVDTIAPFKGKHKVFIGKDGFIYSDSIEMNLSRLKTYILLNPDSCTCFNKILDTIKSKGFSIQKAFLMENFMENAGCLYYFVPMEYRGRMQKNLRMVSSLFGNRGIILILDKEGAYEDLMAETTQLKNILKNMYSFTHKFGSMVILNDDFSLDIAHCPEPDMKYYDKDFDILSNIPLKKLTDEELSIISSFGSFKIPCYSSDFVIHNI